MVTEILAYSGVFEYTLELPLCYAANNGTEKYHGCSEQGSHCERRISP